MSTINQGNFNAKGKNYTYKFEQVAAKHFVLSVAENKKTEQQISEKQFRKVLQSVTTWKASDETKQKNVDAELQKGTKVIDSKINEIEVTPVIIENEIIQEVEVLKTVNVMKPGKEKSIDVFIPLSGIACRIFAQNFINHSTK